jgi:hypothetical protein
MLEERDEIFEYVDQRSALKENLEDKNLEKRVRETRKKK